MGRVRERLRAGLAEVDHRLLSELAARGMVREPLHLLAQPVRVERLHGIRDPGVQRPLALPEKAAVGDLADPVVGEVEPLTDIVQDPAPHQLLQRLRGFMLLETRRAPEETKVELASDDGGDGRQIPAALAERFQVPDDDLADPLGDGELRRWIGRGVFRKRAHALDHRERVALADDPDLFREPGHHGLVAFRRGERSHERERLFLRERRQPQLDEALVTGEIFESPAQERRAGQVLLPGGPHHEDWPCPQSAPDERKEAETHLVAPVEILEDQHHRSVQDEMPDELRHALEELAIVHRTLRGPVPGNGQLGKEARQLRPPRRIEALERLRISVDVAGAKRVDP